MEEQNQVADVIVINSDNETIDLEIVCVYNDAPMFANELLASLYRQKTDYNVIVYGINNISGKYSSMAQAYNSVLDRLNGKWALFVHQDIVFSHENSLDKIINELEGLNSDVVFGSAGAIYKVRETIIATDKPINVETVDECFFGILTERIKKIKFDENLCDNWHMYAVELCLHNRCVGGSVCVIKADIVHLSPGVISGKYIKTLYKIIDYYKRRGVKFIWTTCAKVDMKKPYHIYIYVWSVKHWVLNKIIRTLRRNG